MNSNTDVARGSDAHAAPAQRNANAGATVNATPSDESLESASGKARIHPNAAVFSSVENFLEVDVGRVAIATPGALNTARAANALARGA